MNRRAFLGLLAAVAADPERLLWQPGRKLISIPRPPKIGVTLNVRIPPLRFVGRQDLALRFVQRYEPASNLFLPRIDALYAMAFQGDFR